MVAGLRALTFTHELSMYSRNPRGPDRLVDSPGYEFWEFMHVYGLLGLILKELSMGRYQNSVWFIMLAIGMGSDCKIFNHNV
jgi:hypothetical protein